MKITKLSVGAMLIAMSLSFTPERASANALNGDEIKTLINGKNVALKTRFGTFPLRYGTNGLVTGDGSALGLARFFSPKETGKWWVQGSQLCQQWPSWYDGKTLCFKIEKLAGNQIKWLRNDGATGTATVR